MDWEKDKLNHEVSKIATRWLLPAMRRAYKTVPEGAATYGVDTCIHEIIKGLFPGDEAFHKSLYERLREIAISDARPNRLVNLDKIQDYRYL